MDIRHEKHPVQGNRRCRPELRRRQEIHAGSRTKSQPGDTGDPAAALPGRSLSRSKCRVAVI